MSTSDQDGNRQLTRKQLRELRLTGSTPVISEEEAANAAQPAPVLPRAAEPIIVEPAPEPAQEEADGTPLTRRQAREQERTRTGSVPVTDEPADDGESGADSQELAAPESADASNADAPAVDEKPQIVSEVPRFDSPAPDEAAVDTAPVAVPTETTGVSEEGDANETDEPEAAAPVSHLFQTHPDAAGSDDEDVVDDAPHGEEPILEEPADDETASDETDEAPVAGAESEERPKVGAAFGLGVKGSDSAQPFPPLFDAILEGDSAGSHHTASNALIFTHTPGVGSLSGPVASTGELLITGTYELPEGLGSRGHALGAADGKDVDAVLIDGELAPASSPTPIAASSAVSTSKPAGEVIRPPAPEKGNKLMLTLAVIAGGLALALATVLIIAFTTNLFG
ncbi:hypothetical protein [Microbacterium sp.]|uniref:hypothetical protein n=1 Tax=Microbacterium sp. TaxID=51671 RepID=UPI00281113BD|nr:hypothetical protein [Microbacterium sp.]